MPIKAIRAVIVSIVVQINSVKLCQTLCLSPNANIQGINFYQMSDKCPITDYFTFTGSYILSFLAPTAFKIFLSTSSRKSL